jgi:putative hemolysin
MIDNELDQLSRALIAATDRLNSQDFKDRQAKYVQMEQEFLTLGSELEAEERAVEKAQAALQQHVAVTYLDAEIDLGEPEAEPEADEVLFGADPHFAVLDAESDEFASPRANGAYTD